MSEYCFSGYCRRTDSARTVFYEEGEGADCAWPDCVYAPDCPIAREISQIDKQDGG